MALFESLAVEEAEVCGVEVARSSHWLSCYGDEGRGGGVAVELSH